jgi:hypothetical protein
MSCYAGGRLAAPRWRWLKKPTKPLEPRYRLRNCLCRDRFARARPT